MRMNHNGDQPAPVGTRRDFIRLFAYAAAAGCGLSRLCAPSSFGALLPEPADGAGYVRLRVQDYPELQENGRTLRMAFTSINGSRPFQRPANTNFYPLLITRTGAGAYLAVDSNCTHASHIVEPQGGLLTCPAHGSRYQLDGTRISGPASASLLRRTVHFRPEVGTLGELAVEVPRLGYSVEMRPLDPESDRIELRFIARLNLRYRVMFRSTLDSAWEDISHATSAGGEMGDLPFSPTLSDTMARVWVPRPQGSGFFAVRNLVEQL